MASTHNVGSKSRSPQFEPLELRTLLSVLQIAPPFTDAFTTETTERTNWILGDAGYCTVVNPNAGQITQWTVASAAALGGAGVFAGDTMSDQFSVPYSGQYLVTFSGIASWQLWSVGDTYLIGAQKGTFDISMDLGVQANQIVEVSLYESDLSATAFLGEVASDALSALLDAAPASMGLKVGQKIWEAATEIESLLPEDIAVNLPFEVSVPVYLDAGSHNWWFDVKSETIATALGISGSYASSIVQCKLNSITVDANFDLPEITGFYAYGTPYPLVTGGSLLLSAAASAGSESIQKVQFYRDSNHNGVFDLASDELLGTDTSPQGGVYDCNRTITWSPGSQRFFARAQDSVGRWSPVAAVVETINPNQAVQGNHIVKDGTDWEDDLTPSDQDGLMEAGERVRLRLRIDPTTTVTDVNAVLSTSDPLIMINNAETYYPSGSSSVWPDGPRFDMGLNFNLAPGQTRTSQFNVRVTYEVGGQEYYQDFAFSKTFYAPMDAAFVVSGYTVDDSVSVSRFNNGDGILQSGERVRIRPVLRNVSSVSATDVEAWLSYDGAELTTNGQGQTEGYGDLASGGSASPVGTSSFNIDDVFRSFQGTALLDLHVQWQQNQAGVVVVDGLPLEVAPAAWFVAEWEQEHSEDGAFGVVTPGTVVSRNLLIRNIGSEALIVDGIDCSLGSVDTPSLVVPVGESRTVVFTLSTNGLNGAVSSKVTIRTRNGWRADVGQAVREQELRLSGGVAASTTSIAYVDKYTIDISAALGYPAEDTDCLVATAIGDTDGDGHKEIIALVEDLPGTGLTTPAIVILENDGTGYVCSWTSGTLLAGMTVYGGARNLAVTDITGDGKDDIVFAVNQGASGPGTGGKLFLIQSTGENAWSCTWSGYGDKGNYKDLIVGDADNDGHKEIIVTTTSGSPMKGGVYAFENRGGTSFSEIFTLPSMQDSHSNWYEAFGALTVADSDRDGHNELLFTSGNRYDNASAPYPYGDQLFIYESVGDNAFVQKYAGLDHQTEGWNPYDEAVMAVADLDADGRNEIALAVQGDVALWVWEVSGNDSWASDISSSTYEYHSTNIPNRPAAMAVADSDADGKTEILIALWSSSQDMMVFEASGPDFYREEWRSGNISSETFDDIDVTASVDGPDPEIALTRWEGPIRILTRQRQVDVEVASSSIAATTLTQQSPSTLMAVVRNNGADEAADVAVRFFLGNPSAGGVQIGGDQTINSLPGGGMAIVSMAWTPLQEGSQAIYVSAYALAANEESDPTNNIASRVMAVADDDTTEPTIAQVWVEEHDGDGDGVVGSDERASLSWLVSDASGIGSVELKVDGVIVTTIDNFSAILPQLTAGSHTYAITATDADDSPMTSQETGTFAICEAEKIRLTLGSTWVNAGQVLPVGLGTFAQGGTASGVVFIVHNDGEQTLTLGSLSKQETSGTFVLSALGQTVVPAGGTTYFLVTPDVTTAGPLQGQISLANSSGTTPFTFDVSGLVAIPPDITTTSGSVDFTEDAAEVAVDPGLGLTDADSASLTGATAWIENYVAGQDVLSFAPTGGIAGTFDALSGTLSLTGTAPLAQYQTALRSVAYRNTSSNPDTTARTVSFSADDGTAVGPAASRTVNIVPVNDAPVVTVPGTQSVPQDNDLVFSSGTGRAIAVSDVDAGGNTEQVTLAATHGTLTLGSTAGLATVAGNGTGSVTFTGPLVDLVGALDGLVFHGSPGYSGAASVQVTISDLGNSGVGGPLSDTHTIQVTVTAAPDLTGKLGTTWTLPAAVVAGKSLTGSVSVVVSNLGNQALPTGQKVNISFVAHSMTTGADTPLVTLSNQSVSALAAKASKTFTASISRPAGLPVDNYQIVANIVPVQALNESDVGNNVATQTAAGLTKTIVAAPAFVDVAGMLGTTWTLPSSVVASKALSGRASVVVRNLGNVALPRGQQVTIQFIARDTTNPANPDIVLASLTNQSVSSLAAGGSKTFSATISRPAGLPADSYQIVANIMPVQAMTESDTGNNTATQTAAGATRNIVAAPAFVDLAGALGTTWSLPSSVVAGKALSGKVSVVVKNLGNVALPRGQQVTIQFIARDTTNPANPDIVLAALTYQSVSSLAAGGSKTFSATISRPAGLPADSYQIVANIVSVQALTESGLENNLVLLTAGGLPKMIVVG